MHFLQAAGQLCHSKKVSQRFPSATRPAIGGIAMAVVVTYDALMVAGYANAEFGPDDVLYLKPGEGLTVSLAVTP